MHPACRRRKGHTAGEFVHRVRQDVAASGARAVCRTDRLRSQLRDVVGDGLSRVLDVAAGSRRRILDVVCNSRCRVRDVVADGGSGVLDVGRGGGRRVRHSAYDGARRALDIAFDGGGSALNIAFDGGSSALDIADDGGSCVLDVVSDIGRRALDVVDDGAARILDVVAQIAQAEAFLDFTRLSAVLDLEVAAGVAASGRQNLQRDHAVAESYCQYRCVSARAGMHSRLRVDLVEVGVQGDAAHGAGPAVGATADRGIDVVRERLVLVGPFVGDASEGHVAALLGEPCE